MKETILLLIAALGFLWTVESNAQTTTYTTSFDDAAQQDGWIFFKKGANGPFNNWEFNISMPHSGANNLMHFYPVGGTEVTDDWSVSPVFDFAGGGSIDSVWHRATGFGMPFGIDTVALYLLNGNADPDLATSKTLLRLYTDSTYQNDGVWRVDTNMAVPATSGDSYLAFRYKTTVNWLDVQYDDVTVTSIGAVGIVPVAAEAIRFLVFPNPATNQVRITGLEEQTIESVTLVNLMGQEVRQYSTQSKMLSLQGLENGYYLLRVSTEAGMVTQKLLKN